MKKGTIWSSLLIIEDKETSQRKYNIALIKVERPFKGIKDMARIPSLETFKTVNGRWRECLRFGWKTNIDKDCYEDPSGMWKFMDHLRPIEETFISTDSSLCAILDFNNKLDYMNKIVML